MLSVVSGQSRCRETCNEDPRKRPQKEPPKQEGKDQTVTHDQELPRALPSIQPEDTPPTTEPESNRTWRKRRHVRQAKRPLPPQVTCLHGDERELRLEAGKDRTTQLVGTRAHDSTHATKVNFCVGVQEK